MSDRSNRIVLVVFALILAAGGGLTVAYGTGAFSHRRAHSSIIDAATVHQWERFGARSYIVIGLAGFVLFVAGCALASREWRRNDGNSRLTDFSFELPAATRGQTMVHAPSLSHTLERDLQTIPDVHGALVGLFGDAPVVELRSVLTVDDRINLGALIGHVEKAVERFASTVGFRPHPVQVTIRYQGTSSSGRQLQ